jgi:hypothetical protein
MKTFGKILLALLLFSTYTSCLSSKKTFGPETEQTPSGGMDGGTGSGTIGDDPTKP